MLSKDKPRKRVTSTFNVSVYIPTYLALELWPCRHTTVNAAIVNESATLYTIQLEFVLLWRGLEQQSALWRGCQVVSALDLRLDGREFDYRPRLVLG